jgi:hypothetical protein
VITKANKKRSAFEASQNPGKKAAKVKKYRTVKQVAPRAAVAAPVAQTQRNVTNAAAIPTQFMQHNNAASGGLVNSQTLKTPIDCGLLQAELTSEDLRLVAAAFSTPPRAPSLQLHTNGIAQNTYPFKMQGGGASYFHSVPRPGHQQQRDALAFGAPLRGTSTESEALSLQQMFTGHDDVNGAMSQIDNELHRLVANGDGNPPLLGGMQNVTCDGNVAFHNTSRSFPGLFSPHYQLSGFP